MYLQAAFNQPGWKEAGKAAGPAFWHSSRPVGQFIAGKFGAREILLQKENVLRYLDLLGEEIEDFRKAIKNGDEKAIQETLQHTVDEHHQWIVKRTSGQWEESTQKTQNAPASGWKKLLGIEISGKKP
jgi:hypothetical protein